jgi:hypothetical protein
MSTITFTSTLSTEICCSCGVHFAIPELLQKKLRETHNNFFCPNGHPQHYTGKSEAEKLREELKRKEQELADTVKQKLEVENEMIRTKKRIAAGVCPCCNRTFKQLAAHMKNKHPHYK